jgi:hypothetical protein
MAARPARLHDRPLPLAVQREGLRHFWGLEARIGPGALEAVGSVRPSPLAEKYMIRVVYQLGKPPKLWVLDPRLRRRSPEEPIPHVHDDHYGLRPCLYYPATWEWRPNLHLALTLVPWVLEWLTFYEIWLATGIWLGEGVDHRGLKRDG